MRKKDISTQDFKKAVKYRKKALEPIYVDRLSELLKYPNEYETFQDLVANSSGWKLITGGRTIWSQMLDMGANAGKPFQLHNLPYQEVSIIATTNQFPIVEQAYVMTNLAEAYFPKSQVLHDKYQNYDIYTAIANLQGFQVPEYDEIDITYYGATNNIATVQYLVSSTNNNNRNLL